MRTSASVTDISFKMLGMTRISRTSLCGRSLTSYIGPGKRATHSMPLTNKTSGIIGIAPTDPCSEKIYIPFRKLSKSNLVELKTMACSTTRWKVIGFAGSCTVTKNSDGTWTKCGDWIYSDIRAEIWSTIVVLTLTTSGKRRV